MKPLFTVNAVFPREKDVLKSASIRAYILNEMKRVGNHVRTDLYKTVMYWKHHVTFEYKIHYAGGEIYLLIMPTGSLFSTQLWKWVDQGTSTIGVTFKEQYVPKTKPGVLQSTPGKFTVGKQKIFARKLVATPPGIRPRGWSEMLTKKYEDELYHAVDFAIKRGLEEV